MPSELDGKCRGDEDNLVIVLRRVREREPARSDHSIIAALSLNTSLSGVSTLGFSSSPFIGFEGTL